MLFHFYASIMADILLTISNFVVNAENLRKKVLDTLLKDSLDKAVNIWVQGEMEHFEAWKKLFVYGLKQKSPAANISINTKSRIEIYFHTVESIKLGTHYLGQDVEMAVYQPNETWMKVLDKGIVCKGYSEVYPLAIPITLVDGEKYAFSIKMGQIQKTYHFSGLELGLDNSLCIKGMMNYYKIRVGFSINACRDIYLHVTNLKEEEKLLYLLRI